MIVKGHPSRRGAVNTRDCKRLIMAPDGLRTVVAVTLAALPWVTIGQSSPLLDAPKVHHTDRLPYYTTGFL